MNKQDLQYTNKAYKRLSNRIRENPSEISPNDLEMLQILRLTYKNPLATVFKELCKIAHRVDSNSICTCRIKRIESIISKLQRFKDMEVQRVVDIAGCRCIMKTIDNVYTLINQLNEKERYLPFLVRIRKDYIAKPKESGYSSVHLDAILKEEPHKVIEIQIRSLEQHNWATLVEISDVLFSSQLKECSDKINPDLYKFHQILAKQNECMTLNDKRLLSEISEKYHYLTRLGNVFNNNFIDLRRQRNKLKTRPSQHFFLISTSTKSDNKTPELNSFENFDKAEDEYFKMFEEESDNKNIVLIQLRETTFEKLSIAYSNYFLTYNATLFRVLKAIADVIVYAHNNFRLTEFQKNYKSFWYIIINWFGKKLEEIVSFNNDVNIRRSKKKKDEWFASIASNIQSAVSIINNMQKEFRTNHLYLIVKFIKRRIDKEVNDKFYS